MLKKWPFGLSSTLVLIGVLFYMGCSEEESSNEETASIVTGSCNYSEVPLGDSGLTFQLCADYTAVTEGTSGTVESKCTTPDPEMGNVTGTWSADPCPTANQSATCMYVPEEGGTIMSNVYDPDYNFILDPSEYTDDEEDGGPCSSDGIYVELIPPVTTSASVVVTATATSTKLQCQEVVDVNESVLDGLKEVYAANTPSGIALAWTDEGSCDTTGALYSCVGEQDSADFTTNTYHFTTDLFSNGSVTDEETSCTSDGGTWTAL